MGNFREAWENAYYRYITAYMALIITLIFGFQLYRYFVSVPAESIARCPTTQNSAALVPVIGVFFDG